MPLNPVALLSSPGLPGAGGRAYPRSTYDAAVEWAEAVSTYTVAIVPPSSAHAAAREALVVALAQAFTPKDKDAAILALEQAFAAYAATLAAGMLPAMAASVPPPGPVGFAALLAPPYPTARASAIARLAAYIDTWARTGTALPVGSVTPVPWA